MTVTVGILLNALSTKAKELVEGMRSRVKRDPDVADFAAAFKPLIESFAAAQPGLSEGQVTELANSVIDRAWQRVKGLGGAPSIADWRIVISEAIRAASQICEAVQLRNLAKQALALLREWDAELPVAILAHAPRIYHTAIGYEVRCDCGAKFKGDDEDCDDGFKAWGEHVATGLREKMLGVKG